MAVSRILPRWAPMAAITIGQRIFAKRSADETVLAHEGVHVEQQRRDGWSFYWRYIVSPRRRMEYEAEAYAVNYVAGASLAWIAKTLSGPLYFWPCDRHEAAIAVMN